MSGLPRRRTDSTMTGNRVNCGSSCRCTTRQCCPPGYFHSGCRSSAAAAGATAMSGLPRRRTYSMVTDNWVECGSSCCCTTVQVHSGCRFPAHGAHLRQVLTPTLSRRCMPRACRGAFATRAASRAARTVRDLVAQARVRSVEGAKGAEGVDGGCGGCAEGGCGGGGGCAEGVGRVGGCGRGGRAYGAYVGFGGCEAEGNT